MMRLALKLLKLNWRRLRRGKKRKQRSASMRRPSNCPQLKKNLSFVLIPWVKIVKFVKKRGIV